jgi:hypothetical protein
LGGSGTEGDVKRLFLVTGYPRSRTAWLAAFLSSGRTLCLHEPIMRFGQNFLPMVEYIESLPHRNVGISDSAIPALRGMFAMVYKTAPVLVVERPKKACLESLKNYYGLGWDSGKVLRAEKAFDETCLGLQALEEHFSTVKRISFESLATVEGARVAWEFCCPGEAFDQHRYQAMDRIVCNPKL